MNDWLNPEPDEDQLSLLTEPVEHLGPEPPSPPPGPVRKLQQMAEDAGWVPEASSSCLYVSAGLDTRPLTYLRPEVVPGDVVSGEELPAFFAYVDRDEPSSGGMALSFDDERTKVETVDEHPVESDEWEMASLLRVEVESQRYPDRRCAVLRIKGDNRRFCQAALEEAWRPKWFIGIRDGCAMWTNPSPCTNVIDSTESSIPLRLGVTFWLTDHFPSYGIFGREPGPLYPPGHTIALADGQQLRHLTAWRRWPAVRESADRWVGLFQLEDARGTRGTDLTAQWLSPGSCSDSDSLSRRR